MFSEIKRALFKKSNIYIIVLIVALMLINTYYGGWRTSLLAGNAKDFPNASDMLFFQKYYGNTFRVWGDSYTTIQAIAPVILVAPYLLSYLNERANHFRVFMISREGVKTYILHKVLAIALAGTIVLISAEFIFGVLTFLLTYHNTSKEFLQNIVSYQEAFFFKHSYAYYMLLLLSHALYYFCFLFFATGIASFFKNKIAVIIVPFLFVAILDMILPPIMQPNVVMQFNYSSNFSLYGYCALLISYVIIGIGLLTLSEHRYSKVGH